MWEGDPPDSIDVIRFDGSENNLYSKVYKVTFFHYQNNDTLKYFIGRLFKHLDFSVSDSIDHDLGYILPDVSIINEDVLNMEKEQLEWIVTLESRNIIPIFSIYKSPFHPTENILSPITLQITNSIDIQSVISIMFKPYSFDD